MSDCPHPIIDVREGTCSKCGHDAPEQVRRLQEESFRRFAVDALDARLQYRRRLAYVARCN